VGYTSTQTGPHTDTHNRKNGPSLWDTLAHRQDHIQKDQSYDKGNKGDSMITIILTHYDDHTGQNIVRCDLENPLKGNNIK
jgi:hypothetical protein